MTQDICWPSRVSYRHSANKHGTMGVNVPSDLFWGAPSVVIVCSSRSSVLVAVGSRSFYASDGRARLVGHSTDQAFTPYRRSPMTRIS